MVAIYVWVQAGSVDEAEDQHGAAHFVEHMLFKGTDRRPSGTVATEIEELGGDINAYTSLEQTVLHATVPRDGWVRALDVLTDMALNSRFVPDEMELEREVILEEIRGAKDSPSRVASTALSKALYAPSPSGRPVIGFEQSVREMSRDALMRFYGDWYRGANLIVSLAGDLEPAEVEREVMRRVPPSAPSPHRVVGAAPQPSADALVQSHFPETMLEFAWPIGGRSHPDLPALQLLAGLIAGSPGSVLGSALMLESQCVYNTWAAAEAGVQTGAFLVGIDPVEERTDEALTRLQEHIDQVRAGQHLAQESLERARAQLRAGSLFSRETVDARAHERATGLALFGDVGATERQLAALEAVTLADIQRVAHTWLRPERRILAGLVPESRERPQLPASQPVRSTPPAPEIHRHVLDCGLTVVIEPIASSRVAAVRLVGLGGQLAETASTAGVTELWSRVIGIQAHDPRSLAEFLDLRGGSLGGIAGQNSFGFRADFPLAGLDDALGLVAGLVREPDFDPDELERVRADLLDAIELARSSPSSVAGLTAAKVLFGRHPYSRSILGTAATMKRLGVGSLRRLHRQLVHPNNLVLSVAGGVDPDRTLRRLERLFEGTSGSHARPLPARPAIHAPKQVVRRTRTLERAQAQVLVAWEGARFDSPDVEALGMAASTLGGQGGRLFLELRDKRGLAYSVSADSLDGVDAGAFVGSIATEPSRAEEARRGLVEEVERLAHDGPTEAEVARVKRSALGALAMGRQETSARAAELAWWECYGFDARTVRRTVEERIDAVTASDIRDALARRLGGRVDVVVTS